MNTSAIPERVQNWCKLQGLDLDDPYSVAEKIALAIHAAPDRHDYFRSWITRVPPEQRAAWYDLLCAHVRSFMKPKTLAEYIIMGQQKAEREQLPTGVNEKGEVIDFTPARTAETVEEKLARRAEKVIQESYDLERKKRLTLACKRCTAVESFYADSRMECTEKAYFKGWAIDGKDATCPDCVAKHLYA